MINFSKLQCRVIDSPLGTIALAASDRGLAGVWFVGQKHFPANWPGPTPAPPDQTGTQPRATQPAHRWLDDTVEQLLRYFEGTPDAFTVPLDLTSGTAFQQTVWQQLNAIPHGMTRSYGELAQVLGKPGASRAIGNAVGRNPVSVIVPCHRVLGASGQLTGYAGGLDRKRALLALEAHA